MYTEFTIRVKPTTTAQSASLASDPVAVDNCYAATFGSNGAPTVLCTELTVRVNSTMAH